MGSIFSDIVRPGVLVAGVAWALGATAIGQQGTPPEARYRAAIVALHNFEYEDAIETFQSVQRSDPSFALAYWGEALAYDQILWRTEDVPASRRALARFAPSAAARAARAATAKERDLLGAVEALVADGDAADRHARYAGAMADLSVRYPDDPDVAALAALALLGSTSRGLIAATGAHDVHDRQLAGSDLQRRVSATLENILKTHPEHPGALHYLLHAWDDPEHAQLALDAARTYARVAATSLASSHALHMPAHIFVQLGMWEDAARSDRAAFDASTERARRKKLDSSLRNYHALSWLQYELLQLGRIDEAEKTIAEMASAVAAAGQLKTARGGDRTHQPLLSNLSSMRARFVVETERWERLANEQNFGNVDELFAIGLSAARKGNLGLARKAQEFLEARTQSAEEGDLRPSIAVMAQELAGMIALADGRREDAVRTLQSAATDESALPAPFGLPSPVKPAPELLGEVLIAIGRPEEAIAPLRQTLRRNPNRTLAVRALARAETEAGHAGAATAPIVLERSHAFAWYSAAVAGAVLLISALYVRRRPRRPPKKIRQKR